ncbi:MAG: PHP domain-containing protein [Caldilineaceae bacterium]|nr:PHP domain-containing protein [Caldilineaceae bacterium]
MQVHFSASLTSGDVKRHIPHPFTVPAECSRLTIRLHYAPRSVGGLTNLLTLTLFDPTGFRGAGHRGGDTHDVVLTPTTATRGYLVGSLPPGEWTVQLDTHMVLPGEPVHYTLTITAERDTTVAAAPAVRPTPDFSRVINAKPGWYRGDLHCHTDHSDASWSTAALVAEARRQRFDFIALTDHNTVSPLAEMAALAGDGLLTMGGQELTTFWGHAVCLGAYDWLDWRVDRAGVGMAAIAEERYGQQQLYIIAHPYAIGDPYCTGCRWLYTDMMPGTARLVEIWNGPWFGGHPLEHNQNEDGLGLYYRWLNEGHKLVATAGSDAHGPKGYQGGVGANIVYAQELSTQGILQALAQGHLYLSTGPLLQLEAVNADGERAMMGDRLGRRGEQFTVTVQWADLPAPATLRLLVNGAVQERQSVDAPGAVTWRLPAYGTRWCTAELRGADDAMLAVTNPIFWG